MARACPIQAGSKEHYSETDSEQMDQLTDPALDTVALPSLAMEHWGSNSKLTRAKRIE